VFDASCIFASWAPAVMEFCEAAVYCFPKYPVDTITNIGPLIAGIVILRQSGSQLPFLWLGWSAILTAVFSAFYHGSGTLVGEYLDLFGMHMFIAGCFSLALVKNASPVNVSRFYIIAITLTITLITISLISIHLASPAFAVVCLAVIGIEIKSTCPATAKAHLWRGILTLVVAYIFWLLDFLHILCDPDNHLMTGHGVWHLLCGYVFYCVFKYYQICWNEK